MQKDGKMESAGGGGGGGGERGRKLGQGNL